MMADDPSRAWREDAVRASLETTQQLMETLTDDGFVEWGPTCRVSSKLCVQLGFEHPDAVPEDAFEARIHRAHRARFRTALDHHQATGSDFCLELSLALVDRGWWRFQCRGASTRHEDGTARRTLLCFTALESLQRAEQGRQAAEARIEALEAELSRLRASASRPPPPVPPPSPAGAPPTFTWPQALRDAVAQVESCLAALPDQSSEPTPNALNALADTLHAAAVPPTELEPALQAVAALHEDLALTALNAQLEALRLGQQGTGLAAVAGHMKQLAKDTEVASEVFTELLRREREERRTWALTTVRMASEAAALADRPPPPRLGRLRAAVRAVSALRPDGRPQSSSSAGPT